MSLNSSPLPVTVSDATWPDDDVFRQALQVSWVDQYAQYLGQAVAESLVQHLLASGELYPTGEQPLVVARSADRLVGVACLRPLQGLSLITTLEVLETSQRSGVGSALIAALEQRSERLLAHVSIHRPYVRTFYQGLGFTVLERSTVDHYGHLLEFDVLDK